MRRQLPNYLRKNQPIGITVTLLAGILFGGNTVANATPAAPSSAPKITRFIVQTREGSPLSRRTVRLALRGKVSRLGRALSGANYAIVEATSEEAERLVADSRVLSVSPDREVRGVSLPSLDVDRAALGTDQVNGTFGFSGSTTGAGVGVAVIDSGIALHPDVALSITGFKDFVNGRSVPYDDYGHGTHIAGLIAGSGLAGLVTGSDADYRGVAPGAHLVGVKVLNSQGVGRISDVIAALDWCVANKDRYALRVINLSLSASVLSSYTTDPLCQAAERAVRAGLVVVASAGNWGGTYGTIGAPGNDPSVITVGASNTGATVARSNDTITTFTGRGPTRYDIQIKPDLVAPGNNIVSLRDPGATIDTVYPSQTRDSDSPFYAHLSGTSMSAALVSGAAALLLDANSKLTPIGVKAALLFTAQVLSGYDPVTHLTTYYDPFVQGSGELNIVGAVDMASRMRKHTGFTGTPTLSSLIGGEASPWAAQTIPQILARPGLTWGSTLLWGGVTGKSISDARLVWGSNVVWGGTENPPPPKIHAPDNPDPLTWGDSLIYGQNVVWGGTENPPPPNITDLVWGNNVVWGGTENPPPPITNPNPIVNANNVVWGGTENPPPPRIDDATGATVGGDNQYWGGPGRGIIVPDPVTGPTP